MSASARVLVALDTRTTGCQCRQRPWPGGLVVTDRPVGAGGDRRAHLSMTLKSIPASLNGCAGRSSTSASARLSWGYPSPIRWFSPSSTDPFRSPIPRSRRCSWTAERMRTSADCPLVSGRSSSGATTPTCSAVQSTDQQSAPCTGSSLLRTGTAGPHSSGEAKCRPQHAPRNVRMRT